MTRDLANPSEIGADSEWTESLEIDKSFKVLEPELGDDIEMRCFFSYSKSQFKEVTRRA